MNRWYSPRGAHRGLLCAAFTAVLWGGWAIGYTQGAADTTSQYTRQNTSAPDGGNAPCCRRRLDS